MATTPYADQTYANAYFAERLGSEAWVAALSATRDVALKHATRLVDTLAFAGYKTSETQAREFPRDGETAVPDDVKQATCEVAIALLDAEMRPDAAMRASAVQSESTGSASLSYRGKGILEVMHEHDGLPSETAARLLRKYLRDYASLEVVRTS